MNSLLKHELQQKNGYTENVFLEMVQLTVKLVFSAVYQVLGVSSQMLVSC